jgi:hypothetical protein
VTGRKPLPGFAQTALGTERLSYVQEETSIPGAFKLRWKVVPDALPDRVVAEGTYELLPDGDGSIRAIDGTIEVRIRSSAGGSSARSPRSCRNRMTGPLCSRNDG